MDGTQQLLCELLEQSTDCQDTIPWYYRVWNQDKLNTYCVCCLALPFYINRDRYVLKRILKCLCDAESGDVQGELIRACEAFSENPYDSVDFIEVVTEVAPEMLLRSPVWFGLELFCRIIQPRTTRWALFINCFSKIHPLEQEIIINFIAYINNRYCSSNQNYRVALEECMSISEIKKYDTKHFDDYMFNPKKPDTYL